MPAAILLRLDAAERPDITWRSPPDTVLRLMWFLKLRWWLSCAFALFVGGWGANIELKGRAQADAFCEWVRIGAPAQEITVAAEQLEEEPLLIVRPDSIAVGFLGILPRSYHVCSITTDQEKVTDKGRLFVNTLF